MTEFFSDKLLSIKILLLNETFACMIVVFLFSLKRSIVTMNDLLIGEKKQWQQLDESLTQLKQDCDQLNTQLTEFSAEVPSLQAEYNQLDP